MSPVNDADGDLDELDQRGGLDQPPLVEPAETPLVEPAETSLDEPAETPSVETRIRAALARVIDPEIRRPITELDMVGEIGVDAAGLATVAIKLTIIGCPAADVIQRDVTAAVASVPGVTGTNVVIGVMSRDERAALTEKLRAGRPKTMQFGPDSLTRVIAITSGKGGVGKSTITANLAIALAARGLRVGLASSASPGRRPLRSTG